MLTRCGQLLIVELADKLLGRTSSKDVLHPKTGEIVVASGQLIDERIVAKIDDAGIESLMVRSVLTCDSKGGVCAKCYGRDLARGTLVNMGETIGVIAAQSIGEPGTQLTMRTFHIGGAAQRGAEQNSVEATHDGRIELSNNNVVIDSGGRRVIMSRTCEMIVRDEDGREKARYKLPYGAKALYEDKSMVKRGDRLAEWDPYTIPIITEKSGIARYRDLINGVSMREVTDEATGISSRVVVDWRQQKRGADLKPRIALRDDKDEIITLANGLEARYFLAVDAILNVEDGQKVHAGDVLARIPRESTKTRDITGGLPRVAELFEARKPKDHAIISEVEGMVEFGTDYKGKRRLIIRPNDENIQPVEYIIPKGKMVTVQEGDFAQKGDLLMDGNPVPHDILKVMGVEALSNYMVNEVQQVYRLQGVTINDKHIEVILHQMLQKVEIIDSGDSTYMVEELLDREEFAEAMEVLVAQGHEPAKIVPVLQGITKASLQTKSFISAASFQETTRVLTEAAVAGKQDRLIGLKENVIVGRLIPAGTGAVMRKYKKIATNQDDAIGANATQKLPADVNVEKMMTGS